MATAKVVRSARPRRRITPTVKAAIKTEGTGNGGNPKPGIHEAESNVVKDTAHQSRWQLPRWRGGNRDEAGLLQPREDDESQ